MTDTPNGAQALIRTLVDSGLDVCFTNPGTSEMHFVAALDTVPEMRGILGLFEGVVTGAADGYARMAGKPAATLLHLGPGLGNGLANLHNARRGRTPLVNIVGDHATYHKQYDAPLESDIDSIAAGAPGWFRRSTSAAEVAADAADAIAATLPDDVIVVDESNTSGLGLQAATAGCPPHDWLCLTGGSIGIGLPLATGAAVGAPSRKVLAVESDGSAMYTFQALWTMAHEALDVAVVIANNGRYSVLDMELDRVGAEAGGPKARAMFDLTGPDIDFVSLAQGLGVPGERVESADALADALDRAYATEGPYLIDAVLPPMAF
jgi:thiamine pyrophosphate-dependent acetolactate synthase large subunit-like protein